MSNVHLNESDEMKNATKDVINLITGHDNNNNNDHDYDETGLIEDEEEDMELIDELKEHIYIRDCTVVTNKKKLIRRIKRLKFYIQLRNIQ
uniref:Uncharacterized protein n=1 Tax=Schistosoma haematobium TaxID=6185 RepID=A0A094ZMR4_SCHHA